MIERLGESLPVFERFGVFAAIIPIIYYSFSNLLSFENYAV